uniref:Uncharacterized protein n=1 Tax=Octopus bimaculoides TaxID=37653 RepID=A0A0L8GA61_OCTBM
MGNEGVPERSSSEEIRFGKVFIVQRLGNKRMKFYVHNAYLTQSYCGTTGAEGE